MTETYPTSQHPYCQENACQVCFKDSDNLAEYLEKRLNLTRSTDILGMYRSWLESTEPEGKGHAFETVWGWWEPSVFSPKYIEGFIFHMTDETEDRDKLSMTERIKWCINSTHSINFTVESYGLCYHCKTCSYSAGRLYVRLG